MFFDYQLNSISMEKSSADTKSFFPSVLLLLTLTLKYKLENFVFAATPLKAPYSESF